MHCDTAAFVAPGCLVLEQANKSPCKLSGHDRPSPFAHYAHGSKLDSKPKNIVMHPHLNTLPTEIIQQIANYVPVSGLISLKLASRRLLVQLPSPPQGYIKTASSCEVKAIRRYLGERVEAAGGRRKCILCDGLMPIAFFPDPGLPVCKWHDGWFSRSIASLSAVVCPDRGRADTMVGGSGIESVLCGHCKVIRGWDAECCNCNAMGDCGSCGLWTVTCHLHS